MQVKYHKDYRHNYLILKSTQMVAGDYQSRMMTDNEISGLLPCKQRHINGERLFYYEITSRQSLAAFYECGGIDMELLCSLFVQLKTTWNAMAGFLLEERFLVLRPEFIFMDAETKEFSFLYYPEEPEEDYLLQLLEFLTEKVDTEDLAAVDAVYKMMELEEKEQFVMDEIVQWFEQDYEMSKCGDNIEEVREDTSMEVPVNREDDIFEEAQGNTFDVHPAARLSRGQLLMCMLASLIIAAGCIAVYFSFFMGNREIICLCAVFMIVLAIFTFCGVQLLCKRFLPEKRKEGQQDTGETNRQKEYSAFFPQEVKDRQEQVMYGDTVFIPWTESCENKLYGMGKGNKNHIDLSHLPLTVGKLAGSVDMVIDEQSISRRHVKFSRENGRICMTDLNSTNGTFKNGMRLLPNTSELLEPGDEIRLGKLKFIYR